MMLSSTFGLELNPKLNTQSDTKTGLHVPVLKNEVIDLLDIKEGEVFVDGTYGRGGYSEAILTAKAGVQVWGIDRDPDAVAHGRAQQIKYPHRFVMLQGCFSAMTTLLGAHNITDVDGIVLDVGVSSVQIDDPARGFSFRFDGPLDMRMSQEGATAADVVNTMKEEDLANIIFTLGEERLSRRIARKIVGARRQKPLTSTKELADIVRSVVPGHKDGLDPATRTFQALRIYVNDELKELESALQQSLSLLKAGGRLVVVSFHSLEDRCVKNFIRHHSQSQVPVSRYVPPLLKSEAIFDIITRQAVIPSAEERQSNPRARSAKLRAARRRTTIHFEERRTL